MYFKIAVVLFLLCMTIAVGKAEEPEPNWAQIIIIRANQFAAQVHDNLDVQKKIDDVVPLDDFKVVIKPTKGYVGIAFTF